MILIRQNQDVETHMKDEFFKTRLLESDVGILNLKKKKH